MRRKGSKGHSGYIGRRRGALQRTGCGFASPTNRYYVFRILAILLTVGMVGSIVYVVYQFVCVVF